MCIGGVVLGAVGATACVSYLTRRYHRLLLH